MDHILQFGTTIFGSSIKASIWSGNIKVIEEKEEQRAEEEEDGAEEEEEEET